MGSDLKRVVQAEEKEKKEKKRPFGRCVWQSKTHGEELKQERAIGRKIQVRASGVPSQKIGRNTVRVWKIEKEKRELHTRKINW